MAELWGAIQQALGWALAAIYDLVPNYGVAILLLTVAVRLLLFPLTVKQIRSMSAMTKIQPQLKELQKKHKGDRAKLNEEMMKLYKEHNVNPFGGCLPLIAQMPVFIALFTVLRGFITVDVAIAQTPEGVQPPPAVYSEEEIANVVCRPTGTATVGENQGLEVSCIDDEDETRTFRVAGFSVGNTEEEFQNLPNLVSICLPRLATVAPQPSPSPSPTGPSPGPSPTTAPEQERQAMGFVCRSALGTGHLPRESDLFADINRDQASFLGMRLGCSATQIGSKVTARQCTTAEDAAGSLADQIPYYLLIALIIVTSYYQALQMARRQTGQAAQQQKMMTRIMPVLFGFISLSLPAGTNVYFLATNLWTIGQQAVVLKTQAGGSTAQAKEPKAAKPEAPPPPQQPTGKGHTPRKERPTPKRKKRR